MRAEQILEMTGTPPQDDALTFLPKNLPLIPLMDVYQDIRKECGAKIAADFSKMMLNSTIPEEKTQLIQYLKKREDYISQACAYQLEKYES